MDKVDMANETYRISTGLCPGALIHSIRKTGVLNPPLLVIHQDKWIVASGFRRLEACLHLGFREICIREICDGLSRLDCIRMVIADNLFGRSLNPVEIGRALALLEPFFKSEKELAREAHAIGLPAAGEKAVKNHLFLAGLKDPLPKMVADGDLSMGMALELGRIEDSQALAFAALFSRVKMSLSKQKEIFRNVTEIAKIEDTTATAVLNEPMIADLLDESEIDPNLKSNQIRDYFHTRRFPQISKAKNKLNRLLSSIPLRPGMRLNPPHNCETSHFSLVLSFQSPQELMRQTECMADILNHSQLEQLWD